MKVLRPMNDGRRGRDCFPLPWLPLQIYRSTYNYVPDVLRCSLLNEHCVERSSKCFVFLPQLHGQEDGYGNVNEQKGKFVRSKDSGIH